MSKSIDFKPGLKPQTIDDWVKGGGPENPSRAEPAEPQRRKPEPPPEPEAMKRFTIDVPVALHRRTKAECARRGVKMADVIRELLEREFPR